jgi:hypothetical protein
MSGVVLEHPLVRIYLRELSAACVTLPKAQARELREQIEAHLDEALPPDADDAAVRTELARLGSPRALAAEVAGPVRPPARARLRNRLSRLRWWHWASIALTAAVLATVIGYPVAVYTAPPLSEDLVSAWYFNQDNSRSVNTTVGNASEWKTPERVHQRQGFVIGIRNNSDWTQTILGLGPESEWVALQPMSVAVGDWPGIAQGAFLGHDPGARWILPAAIPPHSITVLRVLWTSNECMDPGSSIGMTQIELRVRVGLMTRTETIQLKEIWAMSGTKATKCSGSQSTLANSSPPAPSPSRGAKR